MRERIKELHLLYLGHDNSSSSNGHGVIFNNHSKNFICFRVPFVTVILLARKDSKRAKKSGKTLTKRENLKLIAESIFEATGIIIVVLIIITLLTFITGPPLD